MAGPSDSSDRAASSGGKKTGQKDPELVALGGRLRALREAAGLTQEELADSAGLHRTYVGQIERGGRNLTYKNVLRLARGLGVEPESLMPGDRM
jgi:transcriptional regulator with XRE-family HTH domain